VFTVSHRHVEREFVVEIGVESPAPEQRHQPTDERSLAGNL